MKSFILMLFLAGACFAQQSSVSGVVSGIDGPLSGVTLTIELSPSQVISATTDAGGRYHFAAVPPGSYEISARSAGVNTRETLTVNPGQSLVVSFSFDKGCACIVARKGIAEYVTVSADTVQTVEQVSKTVNVIDGQQLRDRADFTLIESLRTIPGFRVQQFGGFGRTASVKTRGLRNQDTALLIDGIRFRDAASITGDASAFLSDITLTSVSRIEVLRGSGSSLYGTNAIGGTVDFQTPKPTSGFHGQLSAAAGELGLRRFRGNVSDGTTDGKFGFTLAVSRTAFTRGIDGNDDAFNTNGQGRIELRPTAATTISTRFFVSDAYVRLNTSPDTLGDLPPTNAQIIDAKPGVNFVNDADDPDSTQKSQFFNGQVLLTQAFNSRASLEASYSGIKTSRKNDDGPLGLGFQSASTSFFDGTIQTVNARLNLSWPQANLITAGYEFETEKFANDGQTPSGEGNFFTRANQRSNTLFVRDLLQLFSGRLQLAGGFRAQIFSLSAPRFSLTNAPYENVSFENPPMAYTFDGSAAYSFRSSTKLRAHVGNGYRVPSLYERFGTFFSNFGTPAFIALGDPNLKPEKSIAFDVGIEQSIFTDRAQLSATYFYTRLIDTIGYGNVVTDVGTTSRPFGGYLNTKGGIARGTEFSAKLRPRGTTDLFVSYTYTNSDQRVPQVSGSEIVRTLGIPSRQFTFVGTQRFQRFWVNFDFLATSSYLAPIFSGGSFQTYVYRFRGNRRADITVGYTFALKGERFGLRLYATAENLFGYEYYENGFKTAGRNSRVGLSFTF